MSDSCGTGHLLCREKTKELMLSQPSVTSDHADRQTGEQTSLGPEDEEDDPYFSSYGHFSIHEEMLKVWGVLYLIHFFLVR